MLVLEQTYLLPVRYSGQDGEVSGKEPRLGGLLRCRGRTGRRSSAEVEIRNCGAGRLLGRLLVLRWGRVPVRHVFPQRVARSRHVGAAGACVACASMRLHVNPEVVLVGQLFAADCASSVQFGRGSPTITTVGRAARSASTAAIFA